jgi:ABC-type polysaccharide/polyol phosphate export permease
LLLFAFLQLKLGFHKYYSKSPFTWLEFLTQLPLLVVICIALGFILSIIRKVYYLINSYLFFTKISTEPLSKDLLKKIKNVKKENMYDAHSE